jgi:hypothetical protein
MNDKSSNKRFPPLWKNPTTGNGGMMGGCWRCHDMNRVLGDLLEKPDSPSCGECHLSDKPVPTSKRENDK